jgi:hypothetical protein
MKQQRRGDVIGQVADDTQGYCRVGQTAEINPQGISIVEGKITRLPALFTQGVDQITVEFDNLQTPGSPQQRHGDCTLPRPDLDDRIGFPRLDSRHDTADDRRVMQKVLAEPFTWTVTQEVILVLVIINSLL